MSVRLVIRAVSVALAFACASVGTSHAQLLSNIGNIQLNANVPQTLTIAITSGSTVNFALSQGGLSISDATPVIATTWNLNPGLTGAVSLYGYFDTPAAALSDGTYDIASTYVEGRMTTGSVPAYTAFTQTNPVGPANGSLLLFSEAITGLNHVSSRSDNLDLQINLTSSPIVPASDYTGVLRIQARAL